MVTKNLHVNEHRNLGISERRNNNNNKLFSSRMYTCLQHIWYKLCTKIANLLDMSSIGPKVPSLAITSTITMSEV